MHSPTRPVLQPPVPKTVRRRVKPLRFCGTGAAPRPTRGRVPGKEPERRRRRSPARQRVKTAEDFSVGRPGRLYCGGLKYENTCRAAAWQQTTNKEENHMLQTLMLHFDMPRYLLYNYLMFLDRYSLPLLCVLGGAGAGVYSYGVRKLSRLRRNQREEMRLHPDEPVPALPEKARQSALAFEIAGFIILLSACLGMFLLGHFDKYLALLGFGA